MKTHFHILNIITLVVVALTQTKALGASDVDNDLEEATGLTEESTAPKGSVPDQQKSTSSEPLFSQGRIRSYLLIGGTKSTGGNDNKSYFPNGQISFSGDYKILSENFVTMDAVANYDAKTKIGNLFVNQAGLRSQWNENIQYFIGKERNRRSPGLIVSPSDFIFSNTNLPGQYEDRKGVWLARLSYQKIDGSLEFLILPVQNETSEGLPESKQDHAGGALRGLYQFFGVDLSFMLGHYLGMDRAGISVQTLFKNKYKFYTEVGTQEEVTIYNKTKKNRPTQILFGYGYEGSEDFSVRLEYFENGQGLNATEYRQMRQLRSLLPSQLSESSTMKSPFVRQKYAITSLSFPEIRKEFNLTMSAIQSLEDDSILGITRIEYLANDNLIMGMSFTQIQSSAESQFGYRNYNTETTLDLKYSF